MMSYKIVRITNLYDEFIRQYYNTFPDIKNQSFQKQHNHLVENSVDTVSSFSQNLRKKGIEAYSIFTNATWLQHQWKLENNCGKNGKDLIAEQIKSIQPDVLWLDDITLIDRNWIAFVRQTVTSIRVTTGHLCAPYNSENLKNLKALDFLITCTPCLRQEFQDSGIETHLLYHGFEASVLSDRFFQNSFPENELLFTGSMYLGGGFHKTRIEYIERFLTANLPLKIYGSVDPPAKALSKMIASTAIQGLKKVGLEGIVKDIPVLKHYEAYGDHAIKLYSRRLKNSMRPPVYGIEQFKLLSKTKLCFNIHGEIARGCAGNARLFEATGVGTCLITDWKSNLGQLFDTDKEVVAYKSIDECIGKIKWLLENPTEAEKIGKAGQLRTLKDHTVEKRVREFNEILKKKM
jgi:spore maturation protein CgeB